jgi:hypothetical protein
MKITEVIYNLQKMQIKFGDLEVMMPVYGGGSITEIKDMFFYDPEGWNEDGFYDDHPFPCILLDIFSNNAA